MNTTEIKRFAIAARRILLKGVNNKLQTLGFNEIGEVTLAQLPVLAYNDTNFNGRIIPGTSFYYQWTALQKAIEEKGISNVCEEVAYTWFNRFVAIRILQKQEKNLIRNVLDFVDDNCTPSIVGDARHGIVYGVSETMREELDRLLLDDTKTTEQFSILISAFCEDTPLLSRIFGRINDYTEILLPNDILSKGGFLDLLNNSTYITDQDYLQTELIGWLYQFYISEKKDQVFDLGLWNADDIPAGTQIFTPNWIVKYMVQNTLGRIYLDKHPDTSFKDDLKYLVEQSKGKHPKYEFEKLEDLRCADLSSGSGHILVEFFDLLFRLYEEEWYDARTAIENIFKYNIVGVDLDTRAMQLSTFALMLKACQKDESFADAKLIPTVLDMPNLTFDDAMPIVNEWFKNNDVVINKEIVSAFRLIEKANELGSIMKFSLSDKTREAIINIYENHVSESNVESEIVKALKLMMVLTESYSAICMNPPYMAAKHMDDILSNYATQHYPRSKNDLFSVFMDVAYDRIASNAKYGMINMQAWMYNKYFTSLRENVLETRNIDSLLHLGARTFDELSGEIVQNAAFVISKHLPQNNGTFFRVVSGENCSSKEALFLSKRDNIIYKNIDQTRFSKIRLSPMGSYWVSDKVVEMFEDNPIIEDVTSAYQGLSTAANNLFIRNWQEVSFNKTGINISSRLASEESGKKWFPTNKGGGQRKWYGNHFEVINWGNDGQEIRNYRGAVLRADECHFKPTITWNKISGTYVTFRYYPQGFVLESASNAISVKEPASLLAFLSSKISSIIASVLNATTNLSNGVVARFPYLIVKDEGIISKINKNVEISKNDWDAHETSWNFEVNPLIALRNQFATDGSDEIQFKLSALMTDFKAYWEHQFKTLHKNEVELNRQFIDIYGLEEELTPDVPMDEVTILQQGEISIEHNQLTWHDDVLIKQFISYAMGCWMGRYRLDKPGLNIAHPNPTEAELSSYSIYGKTFDIDDDGIVPLMDEDSPFADNAVSRLKDFVSLVCGEKHLSENLNYMRECLGMTLEKYFQKEFYKDHLARYQKRPIYWLFQSNRRNAAFQVLVYMHRMDAYSCEKVRTYLLGYIDHLKQRIGFMEQNGIVLTPSETRQLTKMRADLQECVTYEERLHHVANQQIAFDLDDGVKVNYAKFGDVLAIL